MPFNIALSGIRAANSDLRMTGNNIANASTTGFKESRAEFGDIYSTSVLGTGSNQIGSGVRIQNIAQQFTQGNISFTDKILDLSISGEGFFVMDKNGEQMFTRAGTFSLDKEGYIVNNINARLQGYSASPGGLLNNITEDLQIQATNILPQTTTLVESQVNLDSRQVVSQSSGFEYVSSGGTATANVNGYSRQSLTINNPNDDNITINTLPNSNSLTIANNLNVLAGVTATAESTATISTWTNGLGLTINGARVTSTGISSTAAIEISNLPGLTGTYNPDLNTISVRSTIGDLSFEIENSGLSVDQVFTVTGSSGPAQSLEIDGEDNGTTSGNHNVSGRFIGTSVLFGTDLATQGVGAKDYDFNITVDGVTSSKEISLPVIDYTSHADIASALQTAINVDSNLSGVEVIYDTDHYEFRSNTTGTMSSVELTAVGSSANNLGISAGIGVAGASSIVVGGLISMQLDDGYSLTDTSPISIFNNGPTNFVNNKFDPNDPSSYNHSTSVTVYDSLGNAHTMQQYYIKQAEIPSSVPNHWQVVIRIDGRDIGDPVISSPVTPTVATYDIYFNPNGAIDEGLSDNILISNWQPYNKDGTPILGALQANNQFNGGSLPIPLPPTSSNFQLLLTGSSQVGSEFEVREVRQNGSTTGRLASLAINDNGIIFARYTNGKNEILGQIIMANFPNTQGLQSLGDTSWAQTSDSGSPAIGVPGTASLGLIQSGALEESNVELSEQLVNLIIAQRDFQASAKTIETADQITQTIINLR